MLGFNIRATVSPMSSDVAIRLQNVSKVYRVYANPMQRLRELMFPGERPKHEFWALDNVSFEVAKGETVGLIGSNGAGKSTLLQIVSGALKPTSGTTHVEGRIAPMIELGASFNPEFNGRENVTLAADVLGVSGATLRDRLDSIFEFAELGNFIDQPLKTYSSGMYARLAFAVFANLDADVMIVDEILSVGDAAFNQKCMRRIREFKETGAILMTSHDTQALMNLCDRVVWLERGMVRDVGVPQQVCRDYLVAQNAATSSGADFKIGGKRRPPPPTQPHADAPHPPPEPDNPWPFDQNTPRALTPSARITDVSLLTSDGLRKAQWQGGDEAALAIGIRVWRPGSPLAIVFDVRDRLGQVLLSDRAVIEQPQPGDAKARFVFELPELQPEEYVVSVTVLRRDGGAVSIEAEQLAALVINVFRTRAHGLAGANTSLVRLERFDS